MLRIALINTHNFTNDGMFNKNIPNLLGKHHLPQNSSIKLD